jgi:mannose-1-phosphate guanylyltransferase/phosphomannomutase
VKALVLAAGRGTRLRPLSDTIPAVMVEVAGLPLLCDVLHHLASSAVTGVVVDCCRLPQELESAVSGLCGELGLEAVFQVSDEPGGTVAAAARALPMLTDPFLVASGNVLSRQPAGVLSDIHGLPGSGITLALSPVPEPRGETLVTTTPGGRVESLRTGPPAEEAVTNLAFSGMMVCSGKAVRRFAEDGARDFAEDVFPLLPETDLNAMAVTTGGYCRRVNTPEQFLLSCYDVLRGRVQPWYGPPSDGSGRLIQGEVAPGADISGVLWSCRGSVVESGSWLENCVVMGGSVVERDVRLKNSLVLPDTRVPSGTCCDDKYISVLGRP